MGKRIVVEEQQGKAHADFPIANAVRSQFK
jgi:hypothetical protein